MENVFDETEKAQMIESITKAFGDVAARAMAEATSVRVHEIKSGSLGYGGRVFTQEDAKAIKARG